MDMLDLCRGLPVSSYIAGEPILSQDEETHSLFVLSEGVVEVFRGEVVIAIVSTPGAIFGEMSLLLDVPHTASVRAATEAKLFVLRDAAQRLRDEPAMLLPIARLLAKRLQSSNTYLVDLKKQFMHHSDHFGMLDEVLESLHHQQHSTRTIPDDELPAEP